MVIVLILIGLLILYLFIKRKQLHTGVFTMVTGGVKCGKSTVSLYLAIKDYKKRVLKWKIKSFIYKPFKKTFEKPLLYSNIPLSVPYVPLTRDLLLRKKRFVYGSVIFVDECSLVADSQSFRNIDMNEMLLLFNKLIGHETKGGAIYYNTQCIQDVHYAIKRCTSTYYYVYRLVKIPFFCIAYIREDRYSEDGTVITAYNEDVEESLHKVIIPKSVWKKFDCYCFSELTDDLIKVEETVSTKHLKTSDIVSFNKWRLKNNEKKDD